MLGLLGLFLADPGGDREVLVPGQLLAASAVRDRVRQHHQRGGARLLARRAQLAPDVVPVGEAAYHVQAHAMRDGGIDGGRIGQLVVD
ncbi:hypothetical protein AB4212_48140, partial [Streptomyces sp. 2MCAF27]